MMVGMTNYEAGTVAVATVRGVKGVRVWRTHEDVWDSAQRARGRNWHGDTDVADVRPLVVLDLDPTVTVGELGARRNEAQHLVDMLRETADEFFTPDAATLARKVADQIEAQVKPPRIPQPGLYAVVRTKDAEGLVTYRWHSHGGWLGEDGSLHDWDDLIDPVLVREGLDES